MGKGKGSGKFSEDIFFATIFVIGISLILLLEISKFAVGIHYWNDCPASSSIPKYMVGSGGVETVNDVVSGCIQIFTDEAGVASIIVGHLIGIIVGSIYVFKDYSYLAGGCDGAKECCDEDFIKFALAVSIIEWILLFLPVIILAIIGLLTLICEKLKAERLDH